MSSPGQLHLRAEGSLREALAGAVAEMVERAERMARLAGTKPAHAVHEWRKAMRRARAVLRLCKGALSEEDHGPIARAFRQAQRAASGLRDADVLLPVLGELAREKRTRPPERAALKQVERRLRRPARGARSRGPGRRASDTLRSHLGQIRTASARFERGLPLDLCPRDVRTGLSDSYRRAVKSLRRAHRGGDAEFHDLRKSVKVLHYQCELLAGPGAKPAAKWRKRFSRLAEAQGRVTDLLLVRAELAPDEAQALDELLERAIAHRRRPADRDARKLLDEKPRRFGREVQEAGAHRRKVGSRSGATSPKRR